MSRKSITVASLAAVALVVPALAFAGVMPPAKTDYSEGGTVNSLSTGGDKVGEDGLAEKVKDVYFGAYDCYPIPLVVDRRADPRPNMAISAEGEFSYVGKPRELFGDKTPGKVTLSGEFVSADAVDVLIQYKKRTCEQELDLTLDRVEE